jgi:hypothetical protein
VVSRIGAVKMRVPSVPSTGQFAGLVASDILRETSNSIPHWLHLKGYRGILALRGVEAISRQRSADTTANSGLPSQPVKLIADG